MFKIILKHMNTSLLVLSAHPAHASLLMPWSHPQGMVISGTPKSITQPHGYPFLIDSIINEGQYFELLTWWRGILILTALLPMNPGSKYPSPGSIWSRNCPKPSGCWDNGKPWPRKSLLAWFCHLAIFKAIPSSGLEVLKPPLSMCEVEMASRGLVLEILASKVLEVWGLKFEFWTAISSLELEVFNLHKSEFEVRIFKLGLVVEILQASPQEPRGNGLRLPRPFQVWG